MKLGDKAKEVAIEHVKQKASRDILNGIKEWRENKRSTAGRRWIFELIQNAIDTAKARGRNNLEIEVEISNDSFKFKHNGGHFTLDEISAVIYGGSTKPYAPESEYIGRFGTGFLVTHIVSRKVKVKGFILENEDQPIYEFEINIDRESDDEKEISKNIEKCFQQLNYAQRVTIGFDDQYTIFEYEIEDDLGRKAVEQGIQELEKNIQFILAFNKNIISIKLNNKAFKIDSEKRIDDFIRKLVVNNKIIYTKKTEFNDIEVAILIENGFIQSLNGYPKIFVGLPLTETADYIHIPFVVNSVKFDPTKERDALSDGNENRSLLEKAFNEYKSLIEKILKVEPYLKNLFNLVDIKLIPEEKADQNPLWEFFNKLIIQKFSEILDKIPVVETIKNKMTVSEVIFPVNRLDDKELDDEVFNDFCALLREIKQNIPKENELINWLQIAQNLKKIEDISEYISLYDIKDLREELVGFINEQANFPTFDDFAKNFNLENGKQFLLSFFRLIGKLYEKNPVLAGFIDCLLPGQTGIIGPLKRDGGRLYIDEGIPEELKRIINKIGWEIEEELVHKEFANFDMVKDYVREARNVDGVLEKALKDYELKDDDVKQEEDWNDKVFGWIDLFWWCVENDKLSSGFPIITKDETLRSVENLNKEEILVPFKYIGFDEEYEDVYPASRIMHTKYFEEKAEQKVNSLKRYKCFITDLPLYRKKLSISYNKLNSIIIDGKRVSKVTHNIEADEDISYLPFWNEIIGWVSEYQERGKLLFRFIIFYLLSKDESWKKEIYVKCSCREKEHKVIPSHWLANLKTDAWLPFKITKEIEKEGEKTEEEAIEKRVASKEGIENLFSKEELDQLIKDRPETCKFLTHFGFDELDLKIKLKSIEKNVPEEKIRKDISMLVEVSEYITDEFKYILEQNPDALIEAINKTYERLKKEPIKNENRKIGENLEKIIKEIVERNGFSAKPIYKGGDLEIWPEDYEGWDSGLIEITPYLLEIKFTSGNRVHLSKTQGDTARQRKDKYVVLVVENVNDLREKLKEIDDDSILNELIDEVVDNSHIIENIYTKLGAMPDPDEVEPDINGYWIKKSLWEDKNDIDNWLQKSFGDGV